MTTSDGRQIIEHLPEIQHAPVNLSKELIDLKAIADAIFILEEYLMTNQSIKSVSIPSYRVSDEPSNILEDLLMFLFNRPIEVNFYRNPQRSLDFVSKKISNEYSCLFSGGLDSLSGILNSIERYKNVVGCFTVHGDQRNMKKLMRKFESKCKYIHIRSISAPCHRTIPRPSRGFNYILNAAMLGNKNLIIPECGTTMYQPKFTLLDNITLTTHPKVVLFAGKVIKERLNFNTNFIIPNENLTKAEIALSCPEKHLIKLTSSCRTTRYCNSQQPQEGTCYGCINRRLSLAVANIRDSSCRNDIITKSDISMGQFGSILPLLQFCLDYLTDFDSMPDYSSKIIKEYRKEDLFRRWSLEVFAGLLIFDKNREIRNIILAKYLRWALRVTTKDELENRIGEVRENKHKPRFMHVS